MENIVIKSRKKADKKVKRILCGLLVGGMFMGTGIGVLNAPSAHATFKVGSGSSISKGASALGKVNSFKLNLNFPK